MPVLCAAHADLDACPCAAPETPSRSTRVDLEFCQACFHISRPTDQTTTIQPSVYTKPTRSRYKVLGRLVFWGANSIGPFESEFESAISVKLPPQQHVSCLHSSTWGTIVLCEDSSCKQTQHTTACTRLLKINLTQNNRGTFWAGRLLEREP